MKKLYYFISYLIVFGLTTSWLNGQPYSPLSFRLHVQPQASSLSPYDAGFISTESLVSPSFAFGIEVSRNLSKHLEISAGYHYSAQAGNYRFVWCDFMPETLNFIGPTGSRLSDRIGGPDCPLPRGKVRLFKVPLFLGWRFIQKKKYMSRLSFGPQLQASLTQSYIWLHRYRRFSLAFMTEWSNYFRLSKDFSLVAGIRLDRNVTALDLNNEHNSLGNSLGLVLGAEYTLWTQARKQKKGKKEQSTK